MTLTSIIPDSRYLCTVPELEEAFNKSNEEFSAKYGFPKPAKDATNVVIGCRSGKRAASAIGVLEKLGYSSLK